MTRRIAYLGPQGTYSELAARQIFGEAAYIPCGTFNEVIAAVQSGNADTGLLPIENSSEGSVHLTLELLLQTPLCITAETILPIHHQLLSSADALERIEQVWAHPQALAQCRDWLATNVPKAEQHAARSNAEAAHKVAGNTHAAAIAGVQAAEQYRLHILASNIEDDTRNATRFIALAHDPARPTGNDKTSLVCSLPNTAGSLHRLLGIFARNKVNLCKLESRPLPDAVWEYLFYIDCDGHIAETAVQKSLVEAEQHAVFFKLLGSYPKAAGQPL